MIIYNVNIIYDNGKYTSITTTNGNTIQLPEGKHTIHIVPISDPSDNYQINVKVELYTH